MRFEGASTVATKHDAAQILFFFSRKHLKRTKKKRSKETTWFIVVGNAESNFFSSSKCLPVLGLPARLHARAHATQAKRVQEEEKEGNKGWRRRGGP